LNVTYITVNLCLYRWVFPSITNYGWSLLKLRPFSDETMNLYSPLSYPGMIQKRDSEIVDLKSKMSEVMALMPQSAGVDGMTVPTSGNSSPSPLYSTSVSSAQQVNSYWPLVIIIIIIIIIIIKIIIIRIIIIIITLSKECYIIKFYKFIYK